MTSRSSRRVGDDTGLALALAHMHSLWVLMPHRVVLILALLTLTGLADTTGVVLLPPLLALVGVPLTGGTGGSFQTAVQKTLDAVGLTANLPAVLGLFVAVSTLSAAMRFLESGAAATVITRYPNVLRRHLLGSITRAKWSLLAERSSADFSHALTAEVGRIENATYALLSTVSAVMLAFVYLGIAFVISPALSGLVVLVAGGMMLAVLGYTRRAERLGRAASQSERTVYRRIQDHFGGLKLTRSFGLQERGIEAVGLRFDHLTSQREASLRSYAASQFLLQASTISVLAFVVYLSVEYMEIGAASLLVVIYAFGRAMPLLSRVIQGAQLYITEVAGLQTIRELEAWASEGPLERLDDRDDVAFTGELRLESVSFSYGTREGRRAVDGVDIVLRKGTTTAIVGPSGSGKSTVCDLLLGLLSPSEGRVLVDGRKLSTRTATWQEQIGYVPQDPFLFHESISNNLRWAKRDATRDDINEALRRADAFDFVARLPAGLDTVVGDRGSNLSAGERQRIALARALLRNPLLLVLDEPTSSLDLECASRVHRAIDALRGQITIVLVSHQLETVRHASQIYVMEAGRVVESGTWESLSAAQGPGRTGRVDSTACPECAPGASQAVPARHSQANTPGTLLSAYALATVGLVRFALWILPLRPARRVFSAMGRGRILANPQRDASPQTIAEAVQYASRLVPGASCLTQAFAGAILLRQTGRSPTVSLGVAKSPGQEMQAHAWLESDGETLIGGELASGFRKVAALDL